MQQHDTLMENGHVGPGTSYMDALGKPETMDHDTGFSHGAYNLNQQRPTGYSQRHPRRNNMSINTAAQFHPRHNPNDQTAPGTAFDMNFTPLLPSQLLLGSPFQPGTPQYNNGFGSFQQQNSAAHQQNQHNQLGSPLDPQQAAFAPQAYSNMNAGSQQFMNGPQSPTLSLNNGASQGYVSNQHMQMAPTMGSATSRTVYLGNIPPETPAEEILNHVRSGQIESVRLLPDKNCAFISFLDGSSATHFHSDAILKKLAIRGQDIKIGWGKPSQVPTSVQVAVQQSGASRNVYLGNLPETITEPELLEDLGKFGPIDTIKIVKEKAIGFVHFLSIGNAIKAVSQLPQEPKWLPPRRVYYGKDRCAYVSKTQQQNAAQYLGIAPGYAHMLNNADRDLISNALAQQSVAAAAVATQSAGVTNLGNRTVYLGNIHPETTIEEICNVVRGGLLHHIRYIPDKHICFVTFIDPTSAASFFALSSVQGLMIHNRRLKVGWGKHSGALPPAIALAVSGGASRNVYIGNLDETWSEERLRQDFSEYGEIELVNTLREKSCAFVNFTNIANAIKAIEAVRSREEYGRFKVNFGKDRCGNAPRQSSQTQAIHQQHQMLNGRDGVGSPPHINGGYATYNQPESVSPSRSGLSPAPGSTSSASQVGLNYHQQTHHSHSSSSIGNVNPLAMYLNQIGPQESNQDSPQITQQAFNSQQGSLYSDGPKQDPYLNGMVSRAHQQQSHGRNSSLSQSIHPGILSNSTVSNTSGGLLAPRNQHARAISLPAFSQDNLPNGHAHPNQQGHAQQQYSHRQQQASVSGFSGLGAGAQWGALNGWAEESAGAR